MVFFLLLNFLCSLFTVLLIRSHGYIDLITDLSLLRSSNCGLDDLVRVQNLVQDLVIRSWPAEVAIILITALRRIYSIEIASLVVLCSTLANVLSGLKGSGLSEGFVVRAEFLLVLIDKLIYQVEHLLGRLLVE